MALLALLYVSLLDYTAAISVALKCVDGIVIASDSRKLAPGTKVLVSSRSAEKVIALNEATVLCCGSGEKAFYKLYKKLVAMCKRYELVSGVPLDASGVYNLARSLHGGESCHMMIVGCDNRRNGKSEYRIYEILPSGAGVQQNMAVVGASSNAAVSLISHMVMKSAPPLQGNSGRGEHVVADKSTFDPFTGQSTNGVTSDISMRCLDIDVEEAAKQIAETLALSIEIDNESGGAIHVWKFTKEAFSKLNGPISSRSKIHGRQPR
jgi:20S proteasome alpha/beta subunit